MFCKWCGGSIASSDAKCKRCGKEVPVLSDCGGFYDLVPSAKRYDKALPEEQVSTVKIAQHQHNPESRKETGPSKGKKGHKKVFLSLAMLMVVGFTVVILLLVLLLGKVNQYAGEVEGLQEELQILAEQVDSMTIDVVATETEMTEVGSAVMETTSVETVEEETTEATDAFDDALGMASN